MNKELIFIIAGGVLAIWYFLFRRRPEPTKMSQVTKENDVVVSKVGDMKNGEMKAVKVHNTSILLVKDRDTFSAVGNSCTHLQAPLNTGTYLNGTVRCPWHGARFDTTTGTIEDSPGILNLPTFKVHVEGEDVVVTATPEEVAVKKVAPKMAKRSSNDSRTFVVIGAGAAGCSAVFELRASGFEGRIIFIGGEKHYPYDRTKLSKSMSMTADKLSLRDPAEYKQQDIETMFGVWATKLSADEKSITLSTGETINYDSCLIATGSAPIRLEKFIKGNEVPHKNVFVLRTSDDAAAILAACEKKRIVIVGSSFIGVETAAALIPTAASVVVIGLEKVPFERVLGLEIGEVLKKLHESKGIKFIMSATTTEFTVQDDIVTSVHLKDGTILECDAVIIGCGAAPCTQFVEGSLVKKHQDQSIITDQYLATGAPGLYVAGDPAKWPLPHLNNELVRIEHWGIAQTMGKRAARNMVHKVPIPMTSIPVFWTASYGKSVRYAGYGLGVDQTVVDYCGVELDPTNPKFVAYYAKQGKVIAICSMNADPVVADYAQLQATGVEITMSQIGESVKQGKSAHYLHQLVSDTCASCSCGAQDNKKDK